MAIQTVWKYCTAEHCNKMLISYRLLAPFQWPGEKQLACLYALGNETVKHYTAFALTQKNGKIRQLYAPNHLLKQVQRNILHHILDDRPVSPYATAYIRGRGILQNAKAHVGKKTVLKLDIAHFFDSISFEMVRRLAFPAQLFPPSVATLLTHLCCYRGRLPQGAPTSAAISNLVLYPFDRYMEEWCAEQDICYTRYCDDMTFSGDFDPTPVIETVASYLDNLGFRLNSGKTRCLSRGKRQLITGVVVNERPQVPKQYRRALRQELYYCQIYGPASHLARKNPDLPVTEEKVEQYLQSLLGRIQFILSINPKDPTFAQAKHQVSAWIKEPPEGKL